MLCPICKNEIPDKSKYCGKCGSEIPRCPTCGRVLPKKMKYCISDGTAIPEHVLALFPASEVGQKEVPKKRFCIKCGKPCQAGEKYCPECKARMDSGTANESQAKKNVSKQSLKRQKTEEPEKKKRKTILPIIIIVLLLLIIAALLLYLFLGRGDKGGGDQETGSVSESSTAIEDDSGHEDTDESVESVESDSEASKETEESKSEKAESETESISEAEPDVLVELAPPEGSYAEVAISSAAATSVLEPESKDYHYEPYRAIDNDIITSWQEGAEGDGIGEKLTVYLYSTTKVKYICLWGGNWRADEQFRNNNRPKDINIKLGSKEFNVKLSDGMKVKYIVFREPIETNQIVFTFNSVYKGVTSEDLCISEVKVYS